MLTFLIAASLVVMLASLIGVATVWRRFGGIIERNLGVLVSFSAGVFLLIAYTLAAEVFEHAGSALVGTLWIATGVALALLLFRGMPGFHHHHDTGSETHTHSPIDARRILASDAVHNLGDGVLLAAAFAVSLEVGAITTASVFLHELVQEVSEFFVLRQAGYGVRRALTLNLLVSGTILVGAIGGFFLLAQFEMLEMPIVAVAAGMLLVVVMHDLIPHSIRSGRREAQYSRHLAWFVFGALLMWSISTFVGHEVEAAAHNTHEVAESH